MRARMALHISSLEFEHREVLLRDKPASMLAYSPKGTVPVFIMDDGTVIDESEAIMLWALQQNDPAHWLAGGVEPQLALMRTITGDFKYHLDRYKYASRYAKTDEGSKPDRGSVDLAHRDKACAVLQSFEEILTSRAFLMDDQPRLADYGSFPFVRQFANVEPDWWQSTGFAHTRRWLDHLINDDVFQAIMVKHPLWADPAPA